MAARLPNATAHTDPSGNSAYQKEHVFRYTKHRDRSSCCCRVQLLAYERTNVRGKAAQTRRSRGVLGSLICTNTCPVVRTARNGAKELQGRDNGCEPWLGAVHGAS